MPWPKPPCKDCKKRFVGCHGTCSEYKEFKEQISDISKKRIAAYDNERRTRSLASYARIQHYKRRNA